MTNLVRVAQDGGVLILTLARPDKKNALTGEMYLALIAALERADADESIGAVLIEGEGGAFTAGNDIGDFLAHASAGAAMPAFRFVKAIAACDTPLVAAVDGVAVGVGTTMLFHCDLVYAAPTAKFRMPFIDLGLVPEAGSSLTVPARVGRAKAAELLMLGEGFDAAEAHRLGVVNAVVAANLLRDVALVEARRLASKPRAAMRATRRLIVGDRTELMKRIDEEATAFARALSSDEARQAFMTFMAKSAAKPR